MLSVTFFGYIVSIHSRRVPDGRSKSRDNRPVCRGEGGSRIAAVTTCFCGALFGQALWPPPQVPPPFFPANQSCSQNRRVGCALGYLKFPRTQRDFMLDLARSGRLGRMNPVSGEGRT